MNIAIVPARAGSKRIKNKNIKNFLGKPIISYVIKEAIKSKIFDDIIVSTNSDKIKKIAKNCGAKVYFKRPKNLSTDKVTTQKVIIHCLEWLKKKNILINNVCCIYPTAIFTQASDLKKSFNFIKNNKYSFVIASQKYSTQIERAFTIVNNKILQVDKKKFLINSHNFKDFYYDAGQFYWGTVNSWYSKNTLLNNNSIIYELKKYQSIDINTHDDWKLALKLYKFNKNF